MNKVTVQEAAALLADHTYKELNMHYAGYPVTGLFLHFAKNEVIGATVTTKQILYNMEMPYNTRVANDAPSIDIDNPQPKETQPT